MFERYTEKARRVIFFARYEASRFGSETIEPEHLLLGIAREDRELIKVMSGARMTAEVLRKDLEARVPSREGTHLSVELPLAPETKRVLAYAHEESDRLQHRHIGTEHLLLGLLREDRSMAAEILYERGLRLNAVREEIARQTGAETVCSIEESLPEVQGLIKEIRAYGSGLLALSDRLQQNAGLIGSDKAGKADAIKSVAGRHGSQVVLGLERLLGEQAKILRGERVALICNQSSVDHHFHHAADLLHEHQEINLTTLFGPQHGIRGDVQDNMVETGHAFDKSTAIPIYSLYSETREPTEEMLKDLDVLVFDMQDVGCRIYTFIYTLANCMRAAAKYNKRVVVCDRPNPITGEHVAGNVLEPEFASFVGQYPLPTRHGMTVCELARLFNEHYGIGCHLETVLMEGWRRDAWMDLTDAPWVMPSPNMPALATATVFPGTVHLEGTQMSEGRGTTRPFEIIGAPYIEAEEYARALNNLELPGLYFRACGFQPTFQKHAGQACGGAQIHVLDRDVFEPVMTGVATVLVAKEMYGERLRWKEPPYEYVYDKNPFDVIAGTDKLRAAIERGDKLWEITASWQAELEEFKKVRQRFLLY